MIRSEALTIWAAEKYRGHPYFDHCLAVARIADTAVSLGYEVGLCHDMLEDGITTAEELRAQLAQLSYDETEVRQILVAVQELSDVFTPAAFPHLSKKQRRKQENARLASIDPLAQTVKYADLIDGLRWVNEHRPHKREKYAKRKRKLLTLMDKGNGQLRQTALMLFSKQF